MQAFAYIQLRGWEKPRLLRIISIWFNQEHIEAIVVDLEEKYGPRHLTLYYGSKEWNEAVKEITVLNHTDLHPDIRLIRV